eukprot:CAMPEP_0114657626 /NCGR_PEP_ID=MMETSP0191-20121206/14241_1 /TAXON_ID=126664 /ORGANISM="Sorites sp." /LENGTH=392 /DNA_ID=CAMNT_0001877447 /DNA_START=10 /DNA_END=1185 /DNA_ORIENTATION=+
MTYQATSDDFDEKDIDTSYYNNDETNQKRKRYYVTGGVGLFMFVVIIIIIIAVATSGSSSTSHDSNNITNHYPRVITTWNFKDANNAAWERIKPGTTAVGGSNSLNAVVDGCKYCEINRCDGNVGIGGNPSFSNGEVTLDALLMYGPTHDVASVGGIRRIANAIDAARAVMYYSENTMLVGEQAATFLTDVVNNTGFAQQSLETQSSNQTFQEFQTRKCQNFDNTPGNFYKNIQDDTNYNSCNAAEYEPINITDYDSYTGCTETDTIDMDSHASIGVIAIDVNGDMAVGTSTNGLSFKLDGRLSDASIPGSGGYVEHGIGAALSTGNGDILLRFSPSKSAVTYMKLKYSAQDACDKAINEIREYCPNVQAIVLCMDAYGNIGESHLPFNSTW